MSKKFRQYSKVCDAETKGTSRIYYVPLTADQGHDCLSTKHLRHMKCVLSLRGKHEAHQCVKYCVSKLRNHFEIILFHDKLSRLGIPYQYKITLNKAGNQEKSLCGTKLKINIERVWHLGPPTAQPCLHPNVIQLLIPASGVFRNPNLIFFLEINGHHILQTK